MPHTVLIHISGEEAVIGEIDSLPEPTDQVLVVSGARYRDGRNVSYVLPETNVVIWPWARIHCVEIMPGDEEEEVVSFIRE
jgi:hypothetical protein